LTTRAPILNFEFLKKRVMPTPRSALTRRVIAALDASPSRIPVLLGGTGSGRTTLLQLIRDRVGRTAAQYVDIERTATTPERFFQAVTAASPFAVNGSSASGARAAFEAALAFFAGARASGDQPAMFLLDEFLELRTFESFPGLRRVLHEVVEGLAASQNRFVLTSRYTARTLRRLRDVSARFEIVHMPPLTVEDTIDLLGMGGPHPASGEGPDREYTARAVATLVDGQPAYVRALTDHLADLGTRSGPAGRDPISALVGLLSPEGQLSRQIGYGYELRLHRARGYGALKAILEILAQEEGLTLTEISQRMQRTPGSTKDYLSWLEDVDLVTSRHKRYSYADPLLRLWVRLYCRPSAPSEDDLASEVQRYATARLPKAPEPALAMAASRGPADDERKEWGIIEID
jgi:hypothetical protein